MKGLAKRFGWVTLGIILVFLVGNTIRDTGIPKENYSHISWEGPAYEVEYDKTQWNVVFDQHNHTIHSDGVLTPEQTIQWHLAMGFNAMVLTDHNTFGGTDEIREIAREKYNEQIKILPGVEWTTNRIHLNLIFPPALTSKELKVIKKPDVQPTDQEIQAIIKQTHDLGGIVTVDHIPWTNRTWPGVQPGREELFAWGVDYIEIVNEHEWDQESYDFCKKTGMGMITGTDMHTPQRVSGWTLTKAEAFTEEAIFDALKARNTEVVYREGGSPYPYEHEATMNPAYVALWPWIALGDFFTEMTWPQVNLPALFITLGWIYLVFFLIEALRWAGSRLKKK